MSPTFRLGDKVVYTNEFGVCWGVKIISCLCDIEEGKPPHYQYTGISPSHSSVPETHLKPATDYDLLAYKHGLDDYFQDVHGFEYPKSDPLLMNDELNQ